MKIYFYPHAYFRDRHLDTIRSWPSNQVVNPEVAAGESGSQVSAHFANSPTIRMSLQQRIPLVNLKRRPRKAPKDAIVYVWGALVASGDFIVDLDNPWSLVGYNLPAMSIYRTILRRMLLSARCREIRCISEACRESLGRLFGDSAYEKAAVHYPCLQPVVRSTTDDSSRGCRFLFVGSQFEIKGGRALLRAFVRVHAQAPHARLDIVTHLPTEYEALAAECSGIRVHPSRFSRKEIHEQFMAHADVLVLPTYVESFGMVSLEAIANGLAVIATDVYALREMVMDGRNGNLIEPPISIWEGVMPSRYYFDLKNIKRHIANTDTATFESALAEAMLRFQTDPKWRLSARRESIRLMTTRFAC